jgi:hypothetical protein
MSRNPRETYPSPDHQLREIAAILARGILRFRRNAVLAGTSERKTLAIPALTGLMSGPIRGSLTPGVNTVRAPKKQASRRGAGTPRRLSPQPPFNEERACHGYV